MSTVKSKKLQVGTDATSSNNFTIYQPATPDGTLRIGVGNADSPTEVGRFDSNGYVATNAPAFSVYPSSQQAITTSTWTKVALQNEEFDTNNCFDNTTNYRFTPTVEGYYQVSFTCYISAVSGIINAIYKNGSHKHSGNVKLYTTSGGTATTLSALIYMNGTTDYLEFYVWHNSGVDKNTSDVQTYTWATGYLARAV